MSLMLLLMLVVGVSQVDENLLDFCLSILINLVQLVSVQ